MDKRVSCFASAVLMGTTLVAAVPTPVRAQTSAPTPASQQNVPVAAPATEVTVPISDADFRRIKKALSADPVLNIDDEQLRFYVQVLAKQRTFADFVKGYDLMNGPTRGGNPMTHSEFLTMVTPKELHSSGGITATEMLQFAVTNWLGQTLVKRAIEELRNAKSQREVEEIRDRINRELAALKGE